MSKPMTRNFTLRLQEDLRDALAAAAEEDRRPVAGLVRNVLADWLDERIAHERQAQEREHAA
jgi:hypothetical protein